MLCDFFHFARSRHVDEDTIGNFSGKLCHLRPEAGKVDRQARMAGFPRKLEAFAGLINFAFVLDALSGRNLPHNLDVFPSALERPIEDTTVPSGDTLVCNAEA